VPRGRRPGSKISASDAYQFLQHLIREGKVLASDIGRYLEIRKLEERLAALRGGGARRRGRPPGGGTAQPAAAGGRKRRRRRLTAKGLASRQLQGRYLGLIRQIPASQRAKYTKIAKEKNREAAIKEMQSALNK
jgi:cytochrome P450